MKNIPHTRWTFTMVTDARDKDLAAAFTKDAEIKRLRESVEQWKALTVWATAGFLLSVLTMIYYGLKGWRV